MSDISSTREENSGPICRIDRKMAREENNGLVKWYNDDGVTETEEGCVSSAPNFKAIMQLLTSQFQRLGVLQQGSVCVPFNRAVWGCPSTGQCGLIFNCRL